MIKIKNNNIYLTRGDTAYLQVDFDGYKVKEGDVVKLSVKKNFNDEEYAFQLVMPADSVFNIIPSDTKNLTCGNYYYDIELQTTMNEIFTVIGGTFYLLEEVCDD